MSAERDLTIRLKTVVDSTARAAFKEMATLARSTQAEVNKTLSRLNPMATGGGRPGQGSTAADESRRQADLTAIATNGHKKRAGAAAAAHQEELAARFGREAQFADRLASQGAALNRRMAADRTKAIERQLAEEKRAREQTAREQAKQEQQELTRAKRIETAKYREQVRGMKEAERERQRMARTEAMQERKSESARERVGLVRTKAAGATMHFAERGMQIVKGGMLLGAANEKDQEHVIQSLEKIQGFFDIVAGGLGTLRAGEHALHLWRKSAQLAGKAGRQATLDIQGAVTLAQGASNVKQMVWAHKGAPGIPLVNAGVGAVGGGVGAGAAGTAAAVAGAALAGYSGYKTIGQMRKYGVNAGMDEESWHGKFFNKVGGYLDAPLAHTDKFFMHTLGLGSKEDAARAREKVERGGVKGSAGFVG